MKTTRILALVNVLAALTGSVALAQTAAPDQPASQNPTQDMRGPNRPNPEARRKALLDKYDTNKDGKLDDAELAAIGRDVEQGNNEPRLLGVRPRGGMGPGPQFRGGRGPLGPGQRGGRGPGFGLGPQGPGPGFGPGLQARGPGFGRGPMGPRGGQGPGFGPGQMGPGGGRGQGFGPRHDELLQKYDVNHDGQLDETERATIRKEIEDGKLQPPPFGRGLRGFGPPPEANGAPDMPPADNGPQQRD